jgi:hypothetical protein
MFASLNNIDKRIEMSLKCFYSIFTMKQLSHEIKEKDFFKHLLDWVKQLILNETTLNKQ